MWFKNFRDKLAYISHLRASNYFNKKFKKNFSSTDKVKSDYHLTCANYMKFYNRKLSKSEKRNIYSKVKENGVAYGLSKRVKGKRKIDYWRDAY